MLLDNLTEIKDRIAAAASRANRSPDSIKLVAVSKLVPETRIIEALNHGQYIFGENYVQEALQKIPFIKNQTKQKAVFHFIGKLQSNKAKKAAELFDVIETIDSIKLGLSLEKHCSAINKKMVAFVQVNVGDEKQKSGIQPEECEKIIQGLYHCQFLNIVGLMTMPPYFPDPGEARPYFIKLRQLAENMKIKGLLGQHGPVELSMGMSGDFEVAIEEGATVVRIGTAIFGNRSN